ncbi:HAD family hydrolase [Paenibacillus hamazuiensis]|uniref:HAD family hydrolase n=1 Tax=Paenibacillus hamazuiensis TaxID=2936508 RepID=UPI00200E466D|nr:HAD family hydrolase [Paenibacillus hamazuiensis]
MIKAIVFDFDGLILDTESVWYESYKEVLASYHIDLTVDFFSGCVGTHSTALSEYIEERTGIAGGAAKIRALAAELHEKKIASMQAREGVREYLEEAGRLGLRVGLASSSTRQWIDRFLNFLGLSDYFQIIRSRDDVAKVKPDPELYVQAVTALGVRPEEALAFEDSVNGLKAARAAGLWCVVVPNPITQDLDFSGSHLRIRSMADCSLTDVISRLNIGR